MWYPRDFMSYADSGFSAGHYCQRFGDNTLYEKYMKERIQRSLAISPKKQLASPLKPTKPDRVNRRIICIRNKT